MITTVKYSFFPKLSYWKELIINYFYRSKEVLTDVADMLEMEFAKRNMRTPLERTSFIRNWVNTNSVHLIDKEHDMYAFSLHKVIKLTYRHSKNLGSKPHLSCGPRAYLMKAILDFMGYKSRIIDLMDIDKSVPKSHTLLEYYDETQFDWVMQDPDFNVVYIQNGTDKVLSAKKALNFSDEEITYCCNFGEVESLKNLIGTIATYFEVLVLYRYSHVGRKSVVLYASRDVREIKIDVGECLGKYISHRYFDPTVSFLKNE